VLYTVHLKMMHNVVCVKETTNSTCTDDCGVVNGDNSSCTDCNGVVHCGVVNGDNSTCTDDCGVVNGDGSTCLQKSLKTMITSRITELLLL